jgi:hypothetical protein
MPSTLQYPLERHRDLQRRWARLLQRTVAPDKHDSVLATLPQVHHSGAEAGQVPTKTNIALPKC